MTINGETGYTAMAIPALLVNAVILLCIHSCKRYTLLSKNPAIRCEWDTENFRLERRAKKKHLYRKSILLKSGAYRQKERE